MADAETLDDFAGRLGGMAARYAALGSTREDAALIKKLLDSVPNRLYPAVAGIEQFCDVDAMAFEDALGRLKAFDERLRRRRQDGGNHGGEQLMFTAAQWQARKQRRGGRRGEDDDDGARSEASGFGGNRRGRSYKCSDREHFKRECPQWKKAPAPKRALSVDGDVEDGGLL
ncbi:uncharacterized protein LOC119295989 [Triticum dicoccoides]|uniref:uncharacterized protein LOC119295989 n=1 Tax=Triticum dicoccoides TaxID=85692 RepID=UPI00188FEF37|nr:uncharacterized protein LOC119295989 [Triticum dicoccoides]